MKNNEITIELKALTEAARVAYLAYFAAILYAPKTAEFNRLREINDNLRRAIVQADATL